MKKQKVDTSGTAAAQQAIADAQERANNLQRNFSADLKTNNLTQVDAAGEAESADEVVAGTKKRRSSAGLSSQLGINV